MDLYSEYAKFVRLNLKEDRYLEAIAITGVCLDVLLNHMVDGLLTHYGGSLCEDQKETVQNLQKGRHTAGGMIHSLEKASILDRRLVKALSGLNDIRNRLIHPFQDGKTKADAILPTTPGQKDVAGRTERLLCHVIDLAGGSSPRRQERDHTRYMRERHRMREA